jgi:hypothetical protein
VPLPHLGSRFAAWPLDAPVHGQFEYLDAAGLRNSRKEALLFAAYKKTGQLTKNALYVVDICRMVKRRFRDAGLPGVLSPNSFRVTTITDLATAVPNRLALLPLPKPLRHFRTLPANPTGPNAHCLQQYIGQTGICRIEQYRIRVHRLYSF